MLIISFLFFLQ